MIQTAIPRPSRGATWRAVAVVTAALAGAIAVAAGLQGTVTRDDVIRAEPLATSATVAQVKTGAKLGILERNGFWRRVEGPEGQGWLKLSSVRVESGESAGAGLAALATGRGATGNVVTTSGTRGISAEDLTGSSPDTAELQRVEALAVAPEEARVFAADGGLVPRSLAYLARAGDGNASGSGQHAGR